MKDTLTKDEWRTVIESLDYSIDKIRHHAYPGGERTHDFYERVRKEQLELLADIRTKAARCRDQAKEGGEA